MVITDRCVFGFDRQSREMCLESLFPGATVDEIRQKVDGDIKVRSNLGEIDPPGKELLRAMRS